MVCGKCGALVPENTRYCQKCGWLVAPPQDVSATPPSVSGDIASTTSGKAIGSLIAGIFSFIFPAAIVAIILGHISLSDIRKSAGRLKGKGMATAGLVFGYLGIASIPIVLIVAAIAIPNLLRARIAANESSAASAIRILNAAEVYRASAHPDLGYTCALSDLQDQIDRDLATGEKHGYAFDLLNCESDEAGGPNTKFQISAVPLTPHQSGVRAFCSDESGIIKLDANGSAQNCLENGDAIR
jgi:hypothetical protein